MVARLFAPQFLVLYWFAITAIIVHFRGRDRLTVARQLTDHSTLLAPYNVLMYWFSAIPNRPFLPTASVPDLSKLRDNWQVIRDEALALSEKGAIKAADKYNDFGFNSFFRTGWKRFYLKWYGVDMPSAQRMCPRTTELLDLIPNVKAAMFASLPPGARLVRHRHQFADIGTDGLPFGIAEHPFGGGAEKLHDAVFIDDNHGIGHCIENRTEVTLAHSQRVFEPFLFVDIKDDSTQVSGRTGIVPDQGAAGAYPVTRCCARAGLE